MKGTLYKDKKYGWMVNYSAGYGGAEVWPVSNLLHPDDVAYLDDAERVFDNLIARIAAQPIVEFDVVDEKAEIGITRYAKIVWEK